MQIATYAMGLPPRGSFNPLTTQWTGEVRCTKRPRKKHHLSEVTQLVWGPVRRTPGSTRLQSIGPGVCQELEVKEWLLGEGGMYVEGMMHPHLRLSIPRVRWVGETGMQVSLSTPIPWRK